jgi:hypothetical protein
MNEINFLVQGSEPDPYKVSFLMESASEMRAFCTCSAGRNGQYCKHRFNILQGKHDDVLGEAADAIAIVQSWLKGSSIEQALHFLRALEKKEAELKLEISAAKKAVAKAMRG